MEHRQRGERRSEDIHSRLERNLARYDGRISQALVELRREGSSVRCELDVIARWWGELSVQASGDDDGAALDAAFAELEILLDAFVADVPAARPPRALR